MKIALIIVKEIVLNNRHYTNIMTIVMDYVTAAQSEHLSYSTSIAKNIFSGYRSTRI